MILRSNMSKIKKFVFSPFSENTYVVYDGTKECVIIDPGCLMQQEKEMLSGFIEKEELTPVAILQTHTHLDHVFGSAYCKRKFGIPMLMHEADLPVLHDVELRCKAWGIPGYEPVEPDGFLEEGQRFTFGNTVFDILWVPGHAPGHVAFVCHDDGYVLGGDCLFKMSIGRTDFPLCSHNDLIRSIQEKFFSLPDHYLVYAGHMEETTIGFEKKHNPFLKS